MTPTREQCLKMLEERAVPRAIREHGILVARVAVGIAEALRARGHDLDLDIIEAAALLHDIARSEADHARAGANALAARGYGRLAEIVRQHMRPETEQQNRITEVTVVYLADKHVLGKHIVPLERRFDKRRDECRLNPAALRSIEENYRIARGIEGMFVRAMGCSGDVLECLRMEDIHPNGGSVK